jgi:hypothetical protein
MTTKRRKGGDVLPPLPAYVHTVLGPVGVRCESEPRGNKGEPVTAYALVTQREIVIEESLPLTQKWQALYHEWMHFVLYDSGVANVLEDWQNEAVCDAAGTSFAFARIQEVPTARPRGRRG